MIILSKELQEAIDIYNKATNNDEDFLDWYEVLDTINDPSDIKEMKQVIKYIQNY